MSRLNHAPQGLFLYSLGRKNASLISYLVVGILILRQFKGVKESLHILRFILYYTKLG